MRGGRFDTGYHGQRIQGAIFEPTATLRCLKNCGTWFLDVKIQESANVKRVVSSKISLIVNIVTTLVRGCLTTSIKLET